MDVWVAAVWGLAGGLCVEGLELYATIRHTPEWEWRTPIPQDLVAYVLSVVIRVFLGAVVSAATAGSHQVSGPLAAFGLGIAAPLVIEKLARAVPLTAPPPDAASEQTSAAPGSARHLPGDTVGKEPFDRACRSTWTRRQVATREGLKMRADSWTGRLIGALAARQHTVEQIGAMFGVTRQTIYRALERTP